jgi:catalase
VEVAQSSKVRANPASFDDHFSQARLFWASMTPTEKEHIVRAYTFELAKCYEQVVKERQLQSLANIDAVLCREVAAGLGLPVPEPTVSLTGVEPSPALSQLGREWPAEGRMVGIVVDPDGDLEGVRELRQAVFAADMVPLLIAPHGGMVEDLPVQRTFATARSIEFDVLLLAGAPAPAPDAVPARDAKAGAADASVVDPRVELLVDESWRHAKALGGWGAGVEALERAGVTGTTGVVTGKDATEVFGEVQELMSSHRVWERFPASVA